MCRAHGVNGGSFRPATSLAARQTPGRFAPPGTVYYRDSRGFKFSTRVSCNAKPLRSQRKRTLSLYQFFAPGGVLARTHPAYEFRRGQLQMAQAVEQALEEKRHLIVEAGTGTGKTLAYLMPVIRSGKRVIISTGTKNLQEQLFYKDIPFLEQALFGDPASGDGNSNRRLSVCYMKGRNNYLCRKKLYDLTDQPVLSGLEEIEQYRAIAAWEKTTRPATAPNSPNFPRPARSGTSWMRAPTPASGRSAAS
jgi:hypothetical protein